MQCGDSTSRCLNSLKQRSRRVNYVQISVRRDQFPTTVTLKIVNQRGTCTSPVDSPCHAAGLREPPVAFPTSSEQRRPPSPSSIPEPVIRFDTTVPAAPRNDTGSLFRMPCTSTPNETSPAASRVRRSRYGQVGIVALRWDKKKTLPATHYAIVTTLPRSWRRNTNPLMARWAPR